MPTPTKRAEPLITPIEKTEPVKQKEVIPIAVKSLPAKEEEVIEVEKSEVKVMPLSEVFKPIQKVITTSETAKTTKIITAEDYLAASKKKIDIGLAGELFVLKHEKDRHTTLSNFYLVERVRHVSVEEGDGAGYDILSYDEQGNLAYIEVKTTQSDFTSDFYITNSELNHLKSKVNYWIYRVFNYSYATGQGDLYIIKSENDLQTYFNSEPVSFRVTPKRKTD